MLIFIVLLFETYDLGCLVNFWELSKLGLLAICLCGFSDTCNFGCLLCGGGFLMRKELCYMLEKTKI